MVESNTTYERRGGVDANHGIDFEWQTTNLAYLRCEKLHRQWVQDNTLGVKSYFVANNVDGIGAFDDVVIRVEYPHQNEDKTKIIFVQCKHSANPKNCSFENLLKCATVQKYFDSFIEVLRILNDHRTLSCQTYKEIEIRKKTKKQRTQEKETNTEKEQKLRNLFQCKPQDCEFILYSNMILDAGFENTQTQQDNDVSMKILNTARSNEFNISLNAKQLEYLPNEQFVDARIFFEELKQEFATKFRIIMNQVDNVNVELLKSIIPTADIRGISTLLEEEVKCNFQNIPCTAVTQNSQLLENIENFSKLRTIEKNEMEIFLRIPENVCLFSNETIEKLQKQLENCSPTKIYTSCKELEKLKLKQFVTNGFLESKLLVYIKDEDDFSIWTKARKSKLYRILNQIIVCIEDSNNFYSYDRDSNEVFIEIHHDFEIKHSFCFAQFSEETSNSIQNHAITFQGFTVTVNDICGDEWCCLLDEETICRILKGEEITIGSKGFNPLDCYIERKLQFKELVDKNVDKMYSNFSFLEMFHDVKTETKSLTEDEIIAIENKKALLLSGPAGIGKSATLKSLALKYKSKNPSYFVYFIELNKYLNVLKKYEENCDVAGAIEFLAQIILSLQQLEYRLFVYACAEKKNVALFFDAFDEISPDGEKKFSSFLETLLKAQVSSIFVSSRPNFIGTLEKKLKQKSLIFVPFSLDDKNVFFLKYYEKLMNKNATSNEKLELENVISLIIKSMEKETELMAIPLQITMLAEIYFEKFSEMTTEEKMSFSIKMDICSLYNAFIEKLVERYLVEKKKLILQDEEKIIAIRDKMRDAEELACKLICPDINKTPLAEYSDAILKMCNQVGLITNIDPPVFLHRTYGEFLAANWFVQCIKNGKPSSCVSFLCKNILMQLEFREIRRFINAILCNLNLGENDFHIINSDVKILFCQFSCGTSLCFAAEENNVEILKLLLNIDPNMLNKMDFDGDRPVNMACAYGSTEAKQYLLPRTTLILKGERNHSLLHFAAQRGNLIINNLIMEKFPQLLNQKCSDGFTAIHYACKYNNTEVVKLLLSHDNCQINVYNDNQENPLHFASVRGNLEVIMLLLDRDISLLNIKNIKGQTPLHLTLNHDEFDFFASKKIVKKCFIDASKYLLSLNCSVNVKDIYGVTPFHLASMHFNVEIIKLLLERDKTLLNQQDKHGRTPLHFVFNILGTESYGTTRYETVSCLLNFPECDINLTDNQGNTPLHHAALRCYEDVDDDDKILPLFIRRDGLQLNVQNYMGQTALHLAASDCNFNEINVLLSHKECKANAQDINGDTPLHSCIQGWMDEQTMIIMIELIKHDSSLLNIKNHKGQTPLHESVKVHKFEAVDMLVWLGADVNIKDNDNRTPLELARRLAPILENEIQKYKNHRIIETLCLQSNGTATTEPPSGV